jgi:hypothetical protein
MVVDKQGAWVGVAIDPLNGFVIRKENDDTVYFFAPPAGIPETVIEFYHNDASCGDARLLPATPGQGLMLQAYVHSGAVFYTKTIDSDPAANVAILAKEHFEPGQDATAPGACVAFDIGMLPVGPVTLAIDPALNALVPPLRLK